MLRWVFALICVVVGIYFSSNPYFISNISKYVAHQFSLWTAFQDPVQSGTLRLLMKEELAQYTGNKDSPGLYLAILGQVYNIEKGWKHYGPGGSYSFFAGRDASRAFVTGDFTENGLVDDVSGLSPKEMMTLHGWLELYKKEYSFVGKLIGRFYSEKGEATEALKKAEAAISEGWRMKKQSEEENKQFPPCNSEWTSGSGIRYWCSKLSGGVERTWVGVPRKLYKPGSSGYRCACVRSTGPPTGQADSISHPNRGDLDDPALQQYEGCHPLSESCSMKTEQ
ncbi:neuferricin isoform X1 [Protopterus annectens]|uniref:neuferricin isoform X1 n=1 Tax=Protopterus annectens TaxID=7888 RepID=UPI001CFC4473|nr:neuferricin isoform X1 [Protopterus annectens]